jgi:hypothetical protein
MCSLIVLMPRHQGTTPCLMDTNSTLINRILSSGRAAVCNPI